MPRFRSNKIYNFVVIKTHKEYLQKEAQEVIELGSLGNLVGHLVPIVHNWTSLKTQWLKYPGASHIYQTCTTKGHFEIHFFRDN